MAKIPINRIYDHVAAIKAEEGRITKQARKWRGSISSRLMSRSEYYSLHHYLRDVFWHIRKFSSGQVPCLT